MSDPVFRLIEAIDREGAPWVVRQAHVLEAGAGGIVEHRMYCCGPREGAPELAGAYAGAAS